MALNLVNYDASGSDTEEEMDVDQTPSVIINKSHAINVGNIREDTNDIPKPSEAELKLAELARKEKERLKNSEPLVAMSKRKDGRVLIGIPSLADVMYNICTSFLNHVNKLQ